MLESPSPALSRFALGTIVIAALLGTAACRPGERSDATGDDTPTAVPVGSSAQSIPVDGHDRTFRLYRPATLSRPAPVVVFLHGGFGSAEQAESSYGWDAKADAEHFLVVYPDGLDHAWSVGGGCCGAPGRTGVDDVAAITQIVAAVGKRIPVNQAQIFATGISNGGMMAYRLACETTIFAAIGPDSATLLGQCGSPAPVSVLHIHGLADRSVPFDGSVGTGVAHIDGPPIADVIAAWRAVDNCAEAVVSTVDTVTTSIAACPGNRTVELVTIAGAGHQWPGGAPKTVVQRLLQLDEPSTVLNATDVMWAFFASHSKSGA